MEPISSENLRELIAHFSKISFRVKENDGEVFPFEKKCRELFSKDYKINLIDNSRGELSTAYPAQLIIPQGELSSCQKECSESCYRSEDLQNDTCDASKLKDLIMKARGARCRARFPVPVIYFEDKYVCRSATLSGGPEIYGRAGYDFLFAGHSSAVGYDEDSDAVHTEEVKEENVQESQRSEVYIKSARNSEWHLFTKVRSQDIKLLKAFRVGTICDLMVEKKKVIFGMNMTSSEKVDKENRYSGFVILSLPYPGCEFFHEYRENNYSGEGLIFDWSQGFVDAQLDVPVDSISSQIEVEWSHYKSWDLVALTQNYLKLILRYVCEGSSGLLIHCISGWDRTPLFISLLRLSLWADGKIHMSLTPTEITFLTVAYDWFLFGHNLPDRLNKGEEILLFCFSMLKHIQSEDFCVHLMNPKEQLQRDSNGSDCHLDGILLEEERTLGSNTSLNSSCSSVSTRSQENPPAYFTTHCTDSGDETPVHTNGNVTSMQSLHHHQYHWVKPRSQTISEDSCEETPARCIVRRECNQGCNDIENENNHLNLSSIANLSTSPVAVPNSVRQRSESTSSAGCGSWQIITGTGSVRGSASTRSSINSPTYELNKNIHKQTIISEFQDIQEKQSVHLNLRMQKLDSVRSVFYNCYSAAVGFKFKNGADGMFSGIFQIAEKVGLRSGRTSTV